MALYQPGQGLNPAAIARLRGRKDVNKVFNDLPAEDYSKQWDNLLGQGAKKKLRCSQCTRPLNAEDSSARHLLCERCLPERHFEGNPLFEEEDDGLILRHKAPPAPTREPRFLHLDSCTETAQARLESLPQTPSTAAANSEEDAEAQSGEPSQPSTPNDVVAPLKQNLLGLWIGPKGEQYNLSLSPNEPGILCTKKEKEDSAERIPLFLDARDRLVWWGNKRSYFLDLTELQSDRLVWHDSGNGTAQEPNMEWRRTGSSSKPSGDSVKTVRVKRWSPKPEVEVPLVEVPEECCGVEFQQLLIKFLNFLNYDNVDAWELIAHTAGKRALAEYNAFASFAEDMASHFDSESFRQQKFHVMKDVCPGAEEHFVNNFNLQEINHAAHLIENFFQVAWYDHSRQIGKSPVETDINEVRPRFENALKVYQVVQNAADALLYDAVARYGMIPDTPRLRTSGAEVVLVVTVVGPWASVGIVTFWSILRTRTTPLRVFIFGDQAGIRDWRAMMRTVKSATPHVMHRLRFDYIDIFLHPRMIAYFSRLPSECAATNMSKALYARLLCHELLPLDVERAIAIDLGDILVFEDILGLWEILVLGQANVRRHLPNPFAFDFHPLLTVADLIMEDAGQLQLV
eukprot:s232_g12.t2